MSASKNQNIATKLAELESLLEWFESDELNIEDAIKKYEEALKLSNELEIQLKAAKNQIEVVKKKFRT